MKVPEFDITMTATLRPELLERTLDSFYNNLFGVNIYKARLIINIDYVGGTDAIDNRRRFEDINDIIKDYSWRGVKKRVGFKPFFPTAFLWCMYEIETPIFFQLEEDWELRAEINLEDMFYMFDKYENLAHLRLSMFGCNTKTKELKNWTRWLPYNGDFFEIVEDKFQLGWCGHPGLNRSDFMHQCLQHINPTKNPEKQLKGFRYEYPLNHIIPKYRFGSYHPVDRPKPAVFDIGRRWMQKNNWQKQGIKAFFTNWERAK